MKPLLASAIARENPDLVSTDDAIGRSLCEPCASRPSCKDVSKGTQEILRNRRYSLSCVRLLPIPCVGSSGRTLSGQEPYKIYRLDPIHFPTSFNNYCPKSAIRFDRLSLLHWIIIC